MIFANQSAFDDNSRRQAAGVDLRASQAITDPHGNVLAYAQTGGMMSPMRHELPTGTLLFRFGGGGRSAQQVAEGAWWVAQAEFNKLESFAQVHKLSIGMAMRLLCLVPPEWSDATLLIRARVIRDLLAWRGMANTVVLPAGKGAGPHVLPHQNDIAARRLYQLYVPGLPRSGALSVENSYPLSETEGRQGFLYL